jgi:Domain of unknown function (DUF4470)
MSPPLCDADPSTRRSWKHAHFWSKVPATDVINIKANEGVDYAGELRILVTSKYGVRHVIQSLARHPPESKAKLKIYISESDGKHFARSVGALFCLLPRQGEKPTRDDMLRNAEAAIHLTYSAWFTDDIQRLIQSRLALELFDSQQVAWDGDRIKLTYPDRSLTLLSTLQKLTDLKRQLSCVPEDRVLLDDEIMVLRQRRIDHLEEYCEVETLKRLYPARHAGWMCWTAFGMLAPFMQAHPQRNPNVYVPSFLSVGFTLT